MIGSELKFSGYSLSEFGIVEYVEYENLSIDLITTPRTMRTDKYINFKRTVKEITVLFRLFHENKNPREIEEKADSIIGELHSREYGTLEINGYLCEAILTKAKRKIFGETAEIELTFVNFDGAFYGNEQTINFNTNFTNGGLIATDKAIITLTPIDTTCTLTTLSGEKLILTEVSTNSNVEIMLQNKTAKQNGVDVKLSLDSDFFKINKGLNKIVATGCNGNIRFLEVIKL